MCQLADLILIKVYRNLFAQQEIIFFKRNTVLLLMKEKNQSGNNKCMMFFSYWSSHYSRFKMVCGHATVNQCKGEQMIVALA